MRWATEISWLPCWCTSWARAIQEVRWKRRRLHRKVERTRSRRASLRCDWNWPVWNNQHQIILDPWRRGTQENVGTDNWILTNWTTNWGFLQRSWTTLRVLSLDRITWLWELPIARGCDWRFALTAERRNLRRWMTEVSAWNTASIVNYLNASHFPHDFPDYCCPFPHDFHKPNISINKYRLIRYLVLMNSLKRLTNRETSLSIINCKFRIHRIVPYETRWFIIS
jgi:hypothetical protein